MTDSLVLVRCEQHQKEVMGRVVEAPDGVRYQATTYLIPPASGDPMFVRAGHLTRHLGNKQGVRLPEARGLGVDELLYGDQIERWPANEELWGSVPASCEECGENRFIAVDRLRRAVKSNRRTLFL